MLYTASVPCVLPLTKQMEVIPLSIIHVFLVKASKPWAGLIFDRQFSSQYWNTDMLKMVASISHNPRAGEGWLDVDIKWSALHFQLFAAYLSSSANLCFPLWIKQTRTCRGFPFLECLPCWNLFIQHCRIVYQCRLQTVGIGERVTDVTLRLHWGQTAESFIMTILDAQRTIICSSLSLLCPLKSRCK